MAYTFFDNYHQAAKEYAGGNMETYGRLMMIINTYAIDGETMNDLNPVEKLFLSGIKPSIDKSIIMREKAKKGGSVTKESRLQARLQAQNIGACNEIEIEIEKELELEKEIEIVETNDSILSTFSLENNLTIREPAKTKIIKKMDMLSPQVNKKCFLEEHLNYVNSNYGDRTQKEKEALFVKSFEWDSIGLLPAEPPKEKKPKKDNYKGAPKVCTFCGSKLIKYAGVPGVVLCPTCNDAGNKTFWELDKNDVWKCNRN